MKKEEEEKKTDNRESVHLVGQCIQVTVRRRETCQRLICRIQAHQAKWLCSFYTTAVVTWWRAHALTVRSVDEVKIVTEWVGCLGHMIFMLCVGRFVLFCFFERDFSTNIKREIIHICA